MKKKKKRSRIKLLEVNTWDYPWRSKLKEKINELAREINEINSR